MRRRWLAGFAVALMIAGACGGGATSTSGGDGGGGDSGSGKLGPPETDTVTVVTGSHDAGSNGPFIVGTGKGYFADEGLEVKVAIADDPRPALVGDSAQVAVLEVPFTAQAIVEGIDLVMFAGFRCVEPYMIGVQPDIDSVEGLAGENVFLDGVPGNPVVDFRLQLLKDEGWDLSSVNVNYVTLQGDNASWVAQWTEGKIAMTPFYREDLPVLEQHGVNTIVNELIQWPNEVLVAKREFVEQNPDTIEHFIRGMLKSVEWYLDLDNEEEFLEMGRTQDYPTDQAEKDYASGPYLFCENLYVEEESVERQLEVQEVPGAPSFEEFAMIDQLLDAQEAFGLDNGPPPDPPDPNLGLEEEQGT
jgi:ABC-type nitrate/sulfonate/bicarbonate transport system substrate-binding protein